MKTMSMGVTSKKVIGLEGHFKILEVIRRKRGNNDCYGQDEKRIDEGDRRGEHNQYVHVGRAMSNCLPGLNIEVLASIDL